MAPRVLYPFETNQKCFRQRLELLTGLPVEKSIYHLKVKAIPSRIAQVFDFI